MWGVKHARTSEKEVVSSLDYLQGRPESLTVLIYSFARLSYSLIFLCWEVDARMELECHVFPIL